MVTHRERLRERGQSQLSVWLPDSTMAHIKTMAERLELSLPKFIELAALAYLPESTNPPDYVGEMTFELAALADRVKALEGLERRLRALEREFLLDGGRLDVTASVSVEPAAVPDPPVIPKKARSVRGRDGMLP